MRFLAFIVVGCGFIFGAAHAAAQANGVFPPPDVRAASDEEALRLNASLQTITLHQSTGLHDADIKKIEEIEPLLNATYGITHPAAMQMAVLKAGSLIQTQKFSEAESIFSNALPELARRLGSGSSAVIFAQLGSAENLIWLGQVDSAARAYENAASEAVKSTSLRPAEQTDVKAHLAYLKLTQGRFPEARQLAEEVLAERMAGGGPNATGVALARALVARSLAGQGHSDEALILVREGMRIHTREDLGMARLLVAEGEALSSLGRHQDAQKSFGTAAAILLKVLGWNSPETLAAATNMRLEEARFTGSVSRYNFDLPGSPMLVCNAPVHSIPDVYRSLIAAATNPLAEPKLACLRGAQTFLGRAMGAATPLALDVSEYLGNALLDAGDSDPAEAEARALFVARQRINGADHPATKRAAVLYARSLFALGRGAEASGVLASSHTDGMFEVHLLKAARLDAEGRHDSAQVEWEAVFVSLKALPQPTIPELLQASTGFVINQGLLGHCPNEMRDAVVGLADKIGLGADSNGFGIQEAKAVLLACDGKWDQANMLYQTLTRQQNGGELVFQGQGKAMMLARQAIVLARGKASLEGAKSAASEAAFIARERRFTPDRDANGKPLGFRRTRVGTGIDPLALAFAAQVAVQWADKEDHAARKCVTISQPMKR